MLHLLYYASNRWIELDNVAVDGKIFISVEVAWIGYVSSSVDILDNRTSENINIERL